MTNEQQVVLVTGTSNGFGFVGAKALAARGHRVFAAMRESTGRNAKAAQALRDFAATTPIDVLDMDVTQTASVDAAVAAMVQRAGKIDAVIQNAGVMYLGVTEAFTPEQFAEQLNVNAVGTFRVARAVLPLMREQGHGLIANLSSVGGRITLPFAGLYNASKWAIESLTEALRLEVSSFGVECVLIEPGAYATNLMAAGPGPLDTARLPGYASIAEVQGQFMKAFEGIFMNPDMAGLINPEVVAQSFVSLVEAPAGTRPFRTSMGLDLDVGKMNELTEPFRLRALQQLGLGALDKIPSKR